MFIVRDAFLEGPPNRVHQTVKWCVLGWPAWQEVILGGFRNNHLAVLFKFSQNNFP